MLADGGTLLTAPLAAAAGHPCSVAACNLFVMWLSVAVGQYLHTSELLAIAGDGGAGGAGAAAI